MKNKILTIALAVAGVAVLSLALSYKTFALAVDKPTSGSVTIPGSDSDIGGLANTYSDEGSVFKKVINTGITIIAGISVIMIIWGGFQYIMGGDKGASTAKPIITAAVIGLVVSLLAYALVNWVVQLIITT